MAEHPINPQHNVFKKYRQVNYYINPYVFAPPVSTSTNTEIGGVAATISTPALLATKLGISVGNISNFSIVGSDIKCKITGSYAIPSGAFANAGNGCTYYTDSDYLVNNVELTAFYDSNSFANNTVDFQNAVSVGGDAFSRCLAIKYLLKNTTTIGSAGFAMLANTAVCDYYYLPACTVLGASVGNNNVFLNIKQGAKIYCHPSLATNNGGMPDGDISAAATAGAIIRYVSNYTAPSPVTTLAAGTIYNTAIQLNFTAPGSTNAIDFYECYANGVFKSRVTGSGQFISGLVQNTNYNISVYAVDVFYNKSLVSNTVNATTTNSLSDTDAVAYTSASSNTAYQYIIQDLYKMLKDNSLYAKLQAFYPFLGTTAAQHKWNGKNPIDTDAAFRLTFNGTATHSNLGYTPNGTTGYANSYFNQNAVQDVNSNGLTLSVGTNNAAAGSDVIEIGNYAGATSTSGILVKRNSSGHSAVALNGTLLVNTSGNDGRGIYIGVKQSSSLTKLFKNRTLIISGNSGGTLPTFPIFIGALNLTGSAYGFSNQRIQFTAIHEGLSDAEVETLHTIIDTFETALGRKTW